MRPLTQIARLLALLLVWSAGCAGEAPQLVSGQYEGLMLAVDATGRITGYFREEQGQGVTKTCTFFLAGRGTTGEIAVTTWNSETFPGTLKAQPRGVNLRIDKGREHPGCGLVLLPQIAQGLDFDRVANAKWLELRRISAPRTNFHSAPESSRALRSFVVAGDVVAVTERTHGWLHVEYRGKNSTTRGWIPAAHTSELAPPIR